MWLLTRLCQGNQMTISWCALQPAPAIPHSAYQIACACDMVAHALKASSSPSRSL